MAAPAQSSASSSFDLEAYYRKAMDLISAYQFERAQELMSFCYHEEKPCGAADLFNWESVINLSTTCSLVA